MRRRGVLLGVMCAAFLAGSAQARTVVTTPGPYQRWVDESRMPTPPGGVTVRLEPCPAVDYPWSCIYTGENPEMWLAPRHQRSRYVFLHELGHQFDWLFLTRRMRGRFLRKVGFTRGRGWASSVGGHENSIYTGMEIFADVYAYCADPRHRSELPYGTRNTRWACGWIIQAGG